MRRKTMGHMDSVVFVSPLGESQFHVPSFFVFKSAVPLSPLLFPDSSF